MRKACGFRVLRRVREFAEEGSVRAWGRPAASGFCGECGIMIEEGSVRA